MTHIVPEPTGFDRTREALEALLNLVPGGATGVDLLAMFWKHGVEQRTRAFLVTVAANLNALNAEIERIDVQMASAALTEGVLAAARSASTEHLNYLANATARAMTTPEERENDHAMILLRIAGDLTATHIRVLQMYLTPRSDPDRPDSDGIPRMMRRVVELDDPNLAADESLVSTILRDLERDGLFGDHVGTSEPGSRMPSDPSELVGVLGYELIEFVSPVQTVDPR